MIHSNVSNVSTPPPDGVARRAMLEVIPEEPAPPPVEVAPSPSRPGPQPAEDRFFERPEMSLDEMLTAELERLLVVAPDENPARLRQRLLAGLDRQLGEIDRQLGRPEVAEPLEGELAGAQVEIQALLRAVEPGQTEVQVLTPRQRALFDHLRRARLDMPCPDAELRRVAVLLDTHGVDTPAGIDQLLAQARRHDMRLGMGTAAIGQLGYGVGFYLFDLLLAPALAPRLLGRGFLPAFGFGFVAGVLVGLCDAVASAGMQHVAARMACADPAAPVRHHVLKTAAIGAGATFFKNFLLRVVLPTLVIQAVAPEGVDRAVRNRNDFRLDAGGNPPAGAIAAWLRCTLLDSAAAHGRRVVDGPRLEGVLRRMQRPLAAGDFARVVELFGEGVCLAAAAPSTYGVVLGVVAPMIGLLVAAQNAVPHGVGVLTQVVAGAGSQGLRSAVRGGGGTLPVRADENAVRAAISTVMMTALAGGATAVGGVLGARVDAAGFRGCLVGLRGQVDRLRRAGGPADSVVGSGFASGGGGVRRRGSFSSSSSSSGVG